MLFTTQTSKKLSICELEKHDMAARLTAIDKVMATIEFTTDGIVQTANQNFLDAMGYQLAEIVGQHHRMFVPQEIVSSEEYASFWHRLEAGETFKQRFPRVKKNGDILWLEASYNPIFDEQGKVASVIKYATDITASVEHELENKAKLTSIDQVMAVIEFTPQGQVISANDNFCNVMKYTHQELNGLHHRVFVSPDYAQSPEYQKFWQDLGKGIHKQDTFKRFTKSGEVVWLDASYNPIYNAKGDIVKVVKFANDVTLQENNRLELRQAVKVFSDVMKSQALGDLSHDVTGFDANPDLKTLQDAINQTEAKLREVVQVSIEASESVSSASIEVSQGSQDLSNRVQQQAAALEETSATMHEMSSQVQSTSANAFKASNTARQVEESSQKGMEIMKQTIVAMESIQESSSKIEEIVSLIDSIAFQTNLLALNAAVEAARAGEHGRGFAVVSGEVRNLAQKSADAAKDIKKLIEETTDRVKLGATLANDSGEMLSEIHHSIQAMANMIEEIAEASREQAEGVTQVHHALSDIDTVTQQNAALVEETTAASESLKDQADRLKNEMNFFSTQNALPHK